MRKKGPPPAVLFLFSVHLSDHTLRPHVPGHIQQRVAAQLYQSVASQSHRTAMVPRITAVSSVSSASS